MNIRIITWISGIQFWHSCFRRSDLDPFNFKVHRLCDSPRIVVEKSRVKIWQALLNVIDKSSNFDVEDCLALSFYLTFTGKNMILPRKNRLYPPVCSNVPASLQVEAIGWGISIRAKVGQKGRVIFIKWEKNKNLMPACQSRYTFLCVSRLSNFEYFLTNNSVLSLSLYLFHYFFP